MQALHQVELQHLLRKRKRRHNDNENSSTRIFKRHNEQKEKQETKRISDLLKVWIKSWNDRELELKPIEDLNPGSKLKTAVTGKVKPGSKAAKRRKSYCARSLGQLKRASAKTRNDPNSRIRQARRRWKC